MLFLAVGADLLVASVCDNWLFCAVAESQTYTSCALQSSKAAVWVKLFSHRLVRAIKIFWLSGDGLSSCGSGIYHTRVPAYDELKLMSDFEKGNIVNDFSKQKLT